MKKLFFEYVELWLSGLSVIVVLLAGWVVPELMNIEARAWRVAAVTALAVGLVHGVLFYVIRKRREKAKEESRRQLRAKNEELEQRVAERTAEVRALASDLTLAEQRERKAISYVLHDDLQQQLFSIQMQAHFLMTDVASQGAEALGEQVEAIHDALGQAIHKTRTLAIELNPPVLPEAGLDAALEWMTHQVEEEHGIEVDLQSEAPPVMPSEEMRVLLVGAVRELLFNVVKHARVSQATVRLTQTDPDAVQIEVADHGVGFCISCESEGAAPSASGVSGFGLYSVRERLRLLGGQLTVDSEPGAGTRVTIHAPLHANGTGGGPPPAPDVQPNP